MLNFVGNTFSAYANVYALTLDDSDLPSTSNMKELSDITLESIEHSNQILDLLLDRLDNNEPYIKLKVLRILKYIIQNGTNDFKIQLQRKSENVRNATQFRGKMDQLKGDSINNSVRENAKDLMTFMFEYTETPANKKTTTQGFGSNYSSAEEESYKNNVYSSNSNQGSINIGGAKKMQSLSNSNYSSPPANDSLASRVSSNISSMFASNDQGFKSPTNAGDYKPNKFTPTSSHSYLNSASNSNVNYNSHESAQRSKGDVGGGWGNQPTSSSTNNATNNNVEDSGLPFNSLENYAVENRLVEEFTSASGIKSQPSAADLLKFSRQSSTLNTSAITAMLLLKLNNNNAWTSQLKALYGLEQLIAIARIKNLLIENSGIAQVQNILELSNSTNATVKGKALKIASEINLISSGQSNNVKESSEFSGFSSSTSTTQSRPTQPVKSSHVDDILDFTAPNNSQNAPSSFSFVDSSASNTTPQSNDMFDNLNINSQPVSNNDIFSNLNVSSNQIQNSNNSSMFSGLNANTTKPASVIDDLFSIEPAKSNSTFDFMDSSTSSAPASSNNNFGLSTNTKSTDDITNLYNQPAATTYPYSAQNPAYANPQAQYGAQNPYMAHSMPYVVPQTGYGIPNQYAQRPPQQVYQMQKPMPNNDPLAALVQGPSVAKTQKVANLNDQFNFIKLN